MKKFRAIPALKGRTLKRELPPDRPDLSCENEFHVLRKHACDMRLIEEDDLALIPIRVREHRLHQKFSLLPCPDNFEIGNDAAEGHFLTFFDIIERSHLRQVFMCSRKHENQIFRRANPHALECIDELLRGAQERWGEGII